MIRVCAAIFEQGGLIMSARRKKGSHLAGFWEFPGGKIEPGETPEACLVRELEEEFGIIAEVGMFIGESIFDYGTKIIQLLAYKITSFTGELQPVDHDSIQWLSLNELDDVKWAPADIPLIQQYKAIQSTKDFYTQKAESYAAETIGVDLSHLYPTFTLEWYMKHGSPALRRV